jgi:hypothetical protein
MKAKVLQILFKIFRGILIFITILVFLQYVVNTKYNFPEPKPFNGEHIYNPYRNADMNEWRMANFHAHSGKLVPFTENTARSCVLIDSLYNYFGFNIISLSDYQFINRQESKKTWYLPVYEHGFQYFKNHQLVINAKRVNWLDFPLPQTLSNEQSVIDHLKVDTTTLISIVHPVYRNAYTSYDLKYLGNYNCLEIANHEHLFTSCYDTILSEGHPVFIMADDDAHELTNVKDVCSSFTLVNSYLKRDSLLKSIRTGRAIGVKFNISSLRTNEEKKDALAKLPEINTIQFKNDTLTVKLSKTVKSIKFIGQHGIEKKIITESQTGNYKFRKQDTYIRTEIECNDGTIYLLNPLFRYNGTSLSTYSPVFNPYKTWFWRSSFLCLLALVYAVRYQKRNIRKFKGITLLKREKTPLDVSSLLN